MSFVILDLEWNGAYSKRCKRFVNEIIEFGAVKLDESLNVTETFSQLVRPQIGKKLSSHVERLTHITLEDLQQASKTFPQALSDFEQFLGDCVLVTWGRSDILALMENYAYYYESDRLPFVKQYCDLQLYCEKTLGIYDASKQLGLSACAELLAIEQKGLELHRACTDAQLSARCFKKLYNREELKKYILPADDEFYRRITFKPSYITDINDPLIDKAQLCFCCDCCGKKAAQKTKWTLKNKSFRASFVCPSCGNKFIGRVAVKQKFDNIAIAKKIVHIDKEKEQN